MLLKNQFRRYLNLATLVSTLVLGGLSAFAQNTTSSASSAVLPAQSGAQPAFVLGLSMDYFTNLYKGNSYERQESINYSIAPSYQINKLMSVATLLQVVQDTRGSQDSVLNNTPVILSFKEFESQSKTSPILLTGGLIGVLPTDQTARVNQTYNGGAGVSETIKLNFPRILIPTTIELSESYKHNFHVYDVGADGTYNVAYNFSSVLGLTFQLPAQFSVIITTLYESAYGYNSAQAGDKFVTDGTLNWQVTKMFGVNAGISNQGDALQSNGRDSNFSYFKDESAQVHIGIGVTL